VTGSCQRVDGDPELNKCLMGYVLDGKVRLLAVKNSHGNILARSILKVLFDENQQPILLFEDVYGDERYEIALKDFALKKAKATGLRIIVGGVDQHLESFGNVAPYEYEDEDEDCGVTNGVYTINGLDHESDVESSDG
jgi:hypothetical protein